MNSPLSAARASGPAIPAGTYRGIRQGHFRLVEHQAAQGAIDEVIDGGDIEFVSNSTQVSGTLSMQQQGAGDLDMVGGVLFHVGEYSTQKEGIRSGPVNDPVVDGQLDTIEGAAAWVAAWHP